MGLTDVSEPEDTSRVHGSPMALFSCSFVTASYLIYDNYLSQENQVWFICSQLPSRDQEHAAAFCKDLMGICFHKLREKNVAFTPSTVISRPLGTESFSHTSPKWFCVLVLWHIDSCLFQTEVQPTAGGQNHNKYKQLRDKDLQSCLGEKKNVCILF